MEREELGLPASKLLILFGAEDAVNNPYKGFGQLLAALEIIRGQSPELDIEVVIFGSHAPAQPPESPYALRFLGPVRNRDLAVLYSAVGPFRGPVPAGVARAHRDGVSGLRHPGGRLWRGRDTGHVAA